MATKEIKEALVENYPHTNIKDWKRIKKKGNCRLFENKKAGLSFWIYGDDVEETTFPVGAVYFSVDEDPEGSSDLWLTFTPSSYWVSTGACYDQHCGYYISEIYDVPEIYLENEMCENSFVLNGKTKEEAITELTACGLIHNEDYQEFISSYL